jgi:uncharacterized protein YjbJ (UPF0337 family)
LNGRSVVHSYGGGDNDQVEFVAAAVDSTGNVHITGSFATALLTVGTSTLTNAGGSVNDAFVITFKGDLQPNSDATLQAIETAREHIKSNVTEEIENARTNITGEVAQAATHIKTNVTTEIENARTNITGEVAQAATHIKSNVTEEIEKARTNITGEVAAAATHIKSNVTTEIEKARANITGEVAQEATHIKSNVTTEIENARANITGEVQDATDEITEHVSTEISEAEERINDNTDNQIELGTQTIATAFLALSSGLVPGSCPNYPSTSTPSLTLTSAVESFTKLSGALTPIGLRIETSDPACPSNKLHIRLAVLRCVTMFA